MAACEQCALGGGHALCVHKAPLLSTLTSKALAHVASLIRHMAFDRGQALIREDEPLTLLLIINSGSTKAVHITPDGREQILSLFDTGAFLDERDLFGTHTATYTVETLALTRVCAFTRAAFRAAVCLPRHRRQNH